MFAAAFDLRVKARWILRHCHSTIDCTEYVNAINMIRSDMQRFDAKRRQVNERKKQFVPAAYKQQDYPHRLNFYEIPPTAEISLEEFEKWAIDRLRSEYRNSSQIS
jgi:hypothetical protein